MKVELKQINPKVQKPVPATLRSAAVDLVAAVEGGVVLLPGADAKLIPTGIAINLDNSGFAAMILPRSGLGHKQGLVLGNTIGLIDGDYQGELFISAYNRSNSPIFIGAYDRIAQLVIVPIVQADFQVVEEFTSITERGSGGFGSTGTSA